MKSDIHIFKQQEVVTYVPLLEVFATEIKIFNGQRLSLIT